MSVTLKNKFYKLQNISDVKHTISAMWRGIRLSFLTVFFFYVEEYGFGLQFKLLSKPFICTGVAIKPIWLQMVHWWKKASRLLVLGSLYTLNAFCLLNFLTPLPLFIYLVPYQKLMTPSILIFFEKQICSVPWIILKFNFIFCQIKKKIDLTF